MGWGPPWGGVEEAVGSDGGPAWGGVYSVR